MHLWKQNPRNRRIAEVFAKCGMVERSGQGANRMFELYARESKHPPDFTGTDDYEVFLTLYGKAQDPRKRLAGNVRYLSTPLISSSLT